MRMLVVANPGAGQPEPVLSILNDVLHPAGVRWDVAVTHEAGDGRRAAAEALQQGYDVIGAYGGDGTVAEVSAALAGSEVPMAILPGGTGNALAADLGIPGTLAEAAALVIAEDRVVRPVDMGRVGTTPFIVRLTVGFEVSVVDMATRERKDRFGWLAYAFAALQTLGSPPTARYSVTVDGEVHECEGIACIVANSASTGVANMHLADGVQVSDGLLDVVIAQTVDLPVLVGSAADVVTGQEPRILNHWQGRRIRVDADPAQEVVLDGEPCGRTPVDVEVMPGAVSVIVPAGSSTSTEVPAPGEDEASSRPPMDSTS